MAKAAGSARRGRERIDFDNLGANDRRDDELGDTVAGIYQDRLLAEINQQNFYFAAIVGVDSPGRVPQREAVLDPAATARPPLPLVPNRNLDRDSGRDPPPL